MNPFPPGTPEHDAYNGQTGINACHQVFHRWLGAEYDTGSLDAVLSVAACDRLGGDPPWLLVVSGSGNAKTETVGALAGIGAHVTSTVTSEGALLSATPAREKTKTATGGLLRKIGDHGVLVVKDFTSILSMNRDLRGSVLAALREVYDGRWERNVGVDGGKTLTWEGRIVVIGAVTTAYDSAHAVIAAMGDRFALVRVDSTTGRLAAGLQALANVNHEPQMRAELSDAVRNLIDNMNPDRAELTDADMHTLLAVANLVTFARTAVERDYQGNVIDAHAPEMPTRFAKMLGQIVRGGLAIGMEHGRALSTAVRVAGDSMPPLRLAILADLLSHPHSTTTDVRKRLQKPHNTIDRELQALHLLGLLQQNKEEGQTGWRYVLSQQADETALKALVSRKVSEVVASRKVSTGNVGNIEEQDQISREADEAVQEGVHVRPETDKAGNGALHARPETDKAGNGAGFPSAQTPPTTTGEPLWPDDDNCPGCGFGYDSQGHQNQCAGGTR